MRCKEFKRVVKTWGQKYGLDTEMTISFYRALVKIYCANEYQTVVLIDMTERFVVNLNWFYFKLLPNDAREELFKIVTEFAATDPADREDEKRFIIPLPGLVTTDGRQQYLTHKDCNFFACRRKEKLRQTWKEEHLKHVPEVYRQFAVEYLEDKEY